MRKNNLFNKIFHNSEVKSNQRKLCDLNQKVAEFPTLLQELQQVTQLYEVLKLHRKLWRKGFQCPNIGPCEYGMYRTNDILSMTSDEVYLGGVFGLWTHTIEWWERNVDSEEDYNIVLNQYKNQIIINLINLNKEYKKEIQIYKNLNY